jgi:hypothetical protein
MTTTSPNTPAQELIERAKALALAGDFSPDDLGGDIGTMTLRNPDGPELLSIIETLAGLLEANSIELERYREALEYYAREIGDHGKRARNALGTPITDPRDAEIEGELTMDSTDALTRDLIPFFSNIAQMLDEMKIERGDKWTGYNQEQREALTVFLRRAHALHP